MVDFVLASGGVVLFLLLLPTYLGYVRGRQEASHNFALGLLLGLSADVALHGAYTTYDLAWDSGAASLVLVALLVGLHVAFLWGLPSRAQISDAERENGDAREGSWSQALPWLGLGPFLFLQLLIFQNLARLVALTEWSYPLAYAWMLVSHAIGVMAALWALNSGRGSLWPVAAVAMAVLIAVLAVPWGGELSAAGVLVVGQVAAAVLLVTIVAGQGRSSASLGTTRTTVAHGLAMFLFLGLLFGYYVIYDIDLPFGNDLLPPVAGFLLGICCLASLPALPRERPSVKVAWLPAQLSLLLIVVPLVWALTWESPQAVTGNGYPVRIMNYNLHNGFNTDGHLGMEAIARVIEEERPDVVGLQGVSRGWVSNGSLDMLTWLSQRLEMSYVFGPATGELWGNAILSRYPIKEWGSVKLPPPDLLFQRAYVWVRLDLGDGRELRVVNTHLHHIRGDMDVRTQQTQTLLDFWANGDGWAIMGDFNVRRADPQADMMRQAGMVDVIELAGIEPGYTVPSDDPQYRIDYIWLSPDLTVADVTISPSTASDHMAVTATIGP